MACVYPALYSCTHMATVGVRGLMRSTESSMMSNKASEQYSWWDRIWPQRSKKKNE